MENALDQLAANIRRARIAAGLTQEAVAAELGVSSVTSYVRWERGERRPTLENLVRLAAVLGTTASGLLQGVGAPVEPREDIEEAIRLLEAMPPARRGAALKVLAVISQIE